MKIIFLQESPKEIFKAEQRKKSFIQVDTFGVRDDKGVDFVDTLNRGGYKDPSWVIIIVQNCDLLQGK